MKDSSSGNILLVANWESDVGYAWWLMESFWLTISSYYNVHSRKSVLIYPKISKIPESIADSSITVLEHDFRNKSYRNLSHLRSIIKVHDIRNIYLSDAEHYSWFYLLLKTWGIRNIIIHEHTPGERSTPGFLIKFIKNIIFRVPGYSADKFIAVSDFVKARLINATCIPERRCTCVSNGIIPIDANESEKYYAHALFNIGLDKIIVVTTGRATFYKGIDFFIECANALINKHKRNEFHFLYCGEGPDLEKFKVMVQKYNLENSFTFAGKRTDIRKILPSCHIGMHAATGEVGYSLSILEYMSSGLLTIVPNNSSVSGATINNVTGLLYQERDINSCLDKILQYHDSGKTNLIRRNAIDVVRDNYNLKHTHELLIENIKFMF